MTPKPHRKVTPSCSWCKADFRHTGCRHAGFDFSTLPLLGSVFKPPALVAGLDDFAVMRHPVEERGRHLGVSEDLAPFPKRQIRRDDHRGLLVELRDQVEQELGAVLRERQVAKFVQDHDIEPGHYLAV